MRIRNLMAGLVLGLAALGAWAQDTVVYHINDTAEQALAGLRNVKNHLDTDPKAKIVVVTHAKGVQFLMMDAKDKTGNPYEIAVQQLVGRGVKFEVCEITLTNSNLKREQFIQEAQFTPSGVVRLAQLQHQGYAYIKP